MEMVFPGWTVESQSTLCVDLFLPKFGPDRPFIAGFPDGHLVHLYPTLHLDPDLSYRADLLVGYLLRVVLDMAILVYMTCIRKMPIPNLCFLFCVYIL